MSQPPALPSRTALPPWPSRGWWHKPGVQLPLPEQDGHTNTQGPYLQTSSTEEQLQDLSGCRGLRGLCSGRQGAIVRVYRLHLGAEHA